MALFFTTFDDFKPHIGSAEINFDINTLESYIQDAIDINLMPILGADFIADLVNKWNTDDTSAEFLAILPKLRGVIAQFALLHWSADSKLRISDSGLARIENDEVKSAHQWQSIEFKQTRNNTGWSRLFGLLLFLENNTDYPIYQASDEKARVMDRMVWKLSTFADVKNVEGFETVVKLLPYLTEAEDDVVSHAITDAVMATLKADPTTGVNKKAYRYTISAIINYAIAKACKDLPFKISANGIFVETIEPINNNSVKNAQGMAEIDRLARNCMHNYESFMTALREYLDANCSDTVFPTYYAIKKANELEQQTITDIRTRLGEGPVVMM